MLTKEERAAIVERFRECNDCGFYDIYTAITGEKVPVRTTRDEDFTAISNVILNLCDMSNMLELPVDRDGEYVNIGDTVYLGYDSYNVTGYEVRNNYVNVILVNGEENKNFPVRANLITHKAPVVIRLLAQRIRDVLDDENTHTVKFAYVELNHIADIMESLADNDE